MLATLAGRSDLREMAIVAASPDEKRLAFTRASGDRGLFIANLDGTGERQLVAPKSRDFVGSPAWSPDGKTIAYGVGSHSGGLSTRRGGHTRRRRPEQRIGSRAWYFVQALLWLPDGHGLVATANAQFPLFQIWYVSYPGGKARRISTDLNNYSGLSLTWDAGALVTVQKETTSHIWVVAPGDAGSAREISTGHLDGLNGMAWAGNGNLYFEAPDSTQDTQTWTTAADGTARRQITTGHLNGKPAPCGDDRHLVFLSYRVETAHVWRSDPDGGNVRQLTNGEGEWDPECSPEGSWLTYGSPNAENPGIFRMPIDGGTPVRIWHRPGWSRISPDGKLVLIGANADPKVTIIPAEGGAALRTFDRVSELGGPGVVQWSADGAALLYVKTVGDVSNIWRLPLVGGDAKSVTTFTSQRITAFAVSRDGKRLALARGMTRSDVVLIRDLKLIANHS